MRKCPYAIPHDPTPTGEFTMTAALSIWVLLLTVATAGNLLLTLAAIRRIKAPPHDHSEDKPVLPVVGNSIGEFETPAGAGAPLTGTQLRQGNRRALFVTAHCPACRRVISAMRAAKSADRLPPELVSFFLVGDDAETQTSEFATELRHLGGVSVVPLEHPALAAFGGVEVFPTVVDLRDGEIVRVGHRLPEGAHTGGR